MFYLSRYDIVVKDNMILARMADSSENLVSPKNSGNTGKNCQNQCFQNC